MHTCIIALIYICMISQPAFETRTSSILKISQIVVIGGKIRTRTNRGHTYPPNSGRNLKTKLDPGQNLARISFSCDDSFAVYLVIWKPFQQLSDTLCRMTFLTLTFQINVYKPGYSIFRKISRNFGFLRSNRKSKKSFLWSNWNRCEVFERIKGRTSET